MTSDENMEVKTAFAIKIISNRNLQLYQEDRKILSTVSCLFNSKVSPKPAYVCCRSLAMNFLFVRSCPKIPQYETFSLSVLDRPFIYG